MLAAPLVWFSPSPRAARALAVFVAGAVLALLGVASLASRLGIEDFQLDTEGSGTQTSVVASGQPRAGIFRYARSPYAQTGWRDSLASVLRALKGDSEQGLLIARDHYDKLGGHDDGRSEATLVRQLGRSSRTLLRSRVILAA